jgi:hypothetical protein
LATLHGYSYQELPWAHLPLARTPPSLMGNTKTQRSSPNSTPNYYTIRATLTIFLVFGSHQKLTKKQPGENSKKE